MHDLSQNKYIADICGNDSLTLNSFLFGGHIVETRTDCRQFYGKVCDMLALLNFNIHLSGYKYLAALTVMYLACKDYDEDEALDEIAVHYAIDAHYVVDGIAEIIENNSSFISSAAALLYVQLHTIDCRCFGDVMDILGALFKLHYNYTVDEVELRQAQTPLTPLLG